MKSRNENPVFVEKSLQIFRVSQKQLDHCTSEHILQTKIDFASIY